MYFQITMPPGQYGFVDIPRARLERWARNFSKLRTGIPILLETGDHNPQRFSAQHNVGRITGAKMTAKGLRLQFSLTRQDAISMARKGASLQPIVFNRWQTGDGHLLGDTICYASLTPADSTDSNNPLRFSLTGDSPMPTTQPALGKTLADIRALMIGKQKAAFDSAMKQVLGDDMAQIVMDVKSSEFNTESFDDDDDLIVTQPEFAAMSLSERAGLNLQRAADRYEKARNAELEEARQFNDDLAERYPHRFTARV